jgi:tetratricopeptide (TPR) repeat protein
MPKPWWIKATRQATGRSADAIAQANGFRDQGRPVEAAAWYRTALDAGVNDPGIRKQLANMLKDSRQFEDAFQEYKICLSLAPKDSDTLLQLGHLFNMQGKRDLAITYYVRAARARPPSADARRELEAFGILESNVSLNKNIDDILLGRIAKLESLFAEHSQHLSEIARKLEKLSRLSDAAIAEEEVRNQWHSFVPLFLNSASAIARLSAQVDALSGSIQTDNGRSTPKSISELLVREQR